MCRIVGNTLSGVTTNFWPPSYIKSMCGLQTPPWHSTDDQSDLIDINMQGAKKSVLYCSRKVKSYRPLFRDEKHFKGARLGPRALCTAGAVVTLQNTLSSLTVVCEPESVMPLKLEELWAQQPSAIDVRAGQ